MSNGANSLGSAPFGGGSQQQQNSGGYLPAGSAFVQVRNESLLYDRNEAGFIGESVSNAIPEKGYPSLLQEHGVTSLLRFDSSTGVPIDKVSGQPVTIGGSRNPLFGRWKYAESLQAKSFSLPELSGQMDEWTILITIRPEIQYLIQSDSSLPQWQKRQIIARVGDYCLMMFRSEYFLVKLTDPNFDTDASDLTYVDYEQLFKIPVTNYDLTLPDSHPNNYALNRYDWHHFIISRRNSNRKLPFGHENDFEIFAGVMSSAGSFYTMLEHGSSFGNFVKSQQFDSTATSDGIIGDGVNPIKVIVGSTKNLKSIELDQFALFNRELTSTDYQNLYRNGLLSPVLQDDIVELIKSRDSFYKHEIVSAYSFERKNEVIGSTELEISYSSIDVFHSISDEYSILVFDNVLNGATLEYGQEIIATVLQETHYAGQIISSLFQESSFKEPVIGATSDEYAFLTNDEIFYSLKDVISYAPDVSSVVVTNNPYVYINGIKIDIVEGSVRTSEGSFVWNCSLTLGDYANYDLFQKGNDFKVVIGPDEYAMILHKKTRVHSSPAGHRYSIEGYSPTIQHKIPYKRPIDFAYDSPVLASTVANEVDPNIDFRVLDWTIPQNRLSIKNGTKLQALSKLAKAIGATLETTIEGNLYCRYLFPVSPSVWNSYPVAYHLSQYDYLQSLQNDTEIKEYEDCINIASSNQSIISDSMEYKDSGNGCGIITIHLNPVRPVDLVHTSTNVSIEKMFEGEKEECEIVEFKEKSGNTRYIVSQALNYEWLTQDLGAVSFDGKQLSATTDGAYNGHSLLEITYKHHVLEYKVCGNTDLDPVQFLIVDK